MLVCITLKRKLRTISYKTFTNIKTTFLTGFMFVKLGTIFATAKILKINPSFFIGLLCTKDNKNENFKRSLLLFCIRILAINLYLNLYWKHKQRNYFNNKYQNKKSLKKLKQYPFEKYHQSDYIQIVLRSG